MSEEVVLFEYAPAERSDTARIAVDAAARGRHRVSPLLYGKFCEHLGSNIYCGMEAQILRNPTFGRWPFAREGGVDGGAAARCDPHQIERMAAHLAGDYGPDHVARLLEAYRAGCAFWWLRVGASEQVRFSPDVGPNGCRAQRVEVLGGAGADSALRSATQSTSGIGQCIYLPLHRTGKYEFRVVARAAESVEVELSLAATHDGKPAARLASAATTLGTQWTTWTGELEIASDADVQADEPFMLTLTAGAGANIVLGRVLLYPADHVGGADPDVVRILKEAHLPMLRWPGGNFVSGYHWRGGVGPPDMRPTVANPAWDGLEHNLFGTDEFLRYCRAVGCEPLICINAGDGTAEEAAAWVQYCNGSTETPMGRLRADNGHREPYGVKFWEIGNEIFGKWQVSWTTAGGYADRYRRFFEAMTAVDASIEILGCAEWEDGEWNRRLIAEATKRPCRPALHILAGGQVDERTDPKDLFHCFMAYPTAIAERLRALREQMMAAGIDRPRVAITELQLFAHFRGRATDAGSPQPCAIPTPATISEPLYDALIINECIRMGGLVDILTHSATVNHGGGLRKTRERVWAAPAHYGHVMGKALAGGAPVAVKLTCGSFSAAVPHGNLPPATDTPALDALAVLGDDKSRLELMIVHRCADAGAIDVTVDLGGFSAASEAEVCSLVGESPDDKNTPEDPERIVPRASTVRVSDGGCTLTVPPFSLTRVSFARRA